MNEELKVALEELYKRAYMDQNVESLRYSILDIMQQIFDREHIEQLENEADALDLKIRKMRMQQDIANRKLFWESVKNCSIDEYGDDVDADSDG